MNEATPMVSGHARWRTNPNNTAVKLAHALSKAGFVAKAVDNGYAVRIFTDDSKTEQRAIVWLPIGEPTPTGLGDVYLWGQTGDEFQAPGLVGMTDLVDQIARSVP